MQASKQASLCLRWTACAHVSFFFSPCLPCPQLRRSSPPLSNPSIWLADGRAVQAARSAHRPAPAAAAYDIHKVHAYVRAQSRNLHAPTPHHFQQASPQLAVQTDVSALCVCNRRPSSWWRANLAEFNRRLRCPSSPGGLNQSDRQCPCSRPTAREPHRPLLIDRFSNVSHLHSDFHNVSYFGARISCEWHPGVVAIPSSFRLCAFFGFENLLGLAWPKSE